MKTINVKDLMAISGKGGLFRYLAQARNGVVVESLEDKKRHVAPATARVSALDDIAIFTTGEEVPLSDIFMKIYKEENGGPSLSHKASADELKSRFAEILPDYDEDRVYVSDIKKVFQWYNLLQSLDQLEVKEVEEKEEKSDNKQESEGGNSSEEEGEEPGEETGGE